MLNIPRRPGRTDRQRSHQEPDVAVFLGLEELEPRNYADAAPFPAATLFSAAGHGWFTLDGGGGGGGGGAEVLPSSDWDNGHTLMGLTEMWADPRFSRFHGAGQRTVILDSGINLGSSFFGPDDDHNGVADRIVYQYDFANNDSNATDTMGHGSNVAGALASSDPTYEGVAADAGIIALRVFNDQGQGNFSWLERGLQWVVAHAAQYNIASVNMSLGDGAYYNQHVSLYGIGDELATLAGMGVIVTVASGNGYYDGGSRTGVSYPAADPSVISVGAVYGQPGGGFGYGGGAIANTTVAGAIAPFTQRGPLLNILAPGAPIVGPSTGEGLSLMHGTSQASPQIAGLAVLAQQMATELLGRRLSVDEFRTIIVASATTVIDGDDEDDNVTHRGDEYPLVNALGMAEAIWAMRVDATEPVANTAPTLAGVDELAGAVTGRGAVLTFDTLARAAHASDADGDALMYRIDSLGSGSLTINGRAVEVGALIHATDTIVWTPEADAHGAVTAFTLRASDGVADSDEAAGVTIDVDDHSTPGYARGIRLASDAPLTERGPGTNSQPVRDEHMPTVQDLRFIDFAQRQSDVSESSRALSASALFATVTSRLAA